MFVVQQNAAIRFRVAERQCRHPPLAWRQEDSRIFFTSPERSVSRVPYLAPLKKIQGRSFFAFYSSLFSQNIFTGLRHKAAQTHFLPCIFFFRGAFLFSTRPTPDLAPEESKKEKSMLHSLLFYAPSPPSPKERGGEGKDLR